MIKKDVPHKKYCHVTFVPGNVAESTVERALDSFVFVSPVPLSIVESALASLVLV